MIKKNYIFTLVETSSNKAYSALLTKSRIAYIIVGLIAFFCLILLPIFQGLQKIQTNYELQKLTRQNIILRQTFASWNDRIQGIETTLDNISNRNKHIQTLTAPSFSQVQYGVGGPASLTSLNLPSIPEANKTALALSELETQVSWVRKNIGNLEQSVFGRINQISHYPSIRPCAGGWFSSFFGRRNDPFTGKPQMHPGLDISLPTGSKIFATADGVVKSIRTTVIKNKGYGKYIIIEHGFGYETLYAHLSQILVKKGQTINRWDVIALSGDTGKSTAPHLHYGIYTDGVAQNPLYFILQ